MKLKKFLLAPIGALIAGLAFPAAWAADTDGAPAASSSRAGVVVPFSEVQKRDSQKRKPQPADVWKAKNGNELKKQQAQESRKESAAPSVKKDESSKPAPKPAPAEKPAPAPKKDAAAPQPKPAPAPQKAPSAEAPKPAPAAIRKLISPLSRRLSQKRPLNRKLQQRMSPRPQPAMSGMSPTGSTPM